MNACRGVRAARRTALLTAALDLIGEQGGAGVTVRSVCRRAGLTDRYFYENFAGRDELLAGLFLQVADELQESLKTSMAAAGDDQEAQARAAIDAFVAIGWTIRARAGCCWWSRWPTPRWPA